MAEHNHRKREELKAERQYYGIGAILAVGVIGVLGYCLTKPRKHLLSNHTLSLTSLKCSKFILHYKMDKKSIVNDLYHASLIGVFAVGYSMLGKKILKMAPLSIQKFDLEDKGKLFVIISASDMTREYLIKQKILPEHINV